MLRFFNLPVSYSPETGSSHTILRFPRYSIMEFLFLSMLEMLIIFASIANFRTQSSNYYSWMGNEAWTEVLEWPGQKSFQSASKKNFKVKSSGKTGGVFKSAEGLTFMRVYG